MNKNFKFYLCVWAILFAIFNIAVFVSPSEVSSLSKFGGAFWVGYIFIFLAFIGQLVASFIAFKAENLQKLFYKIPLVRISYTGLILTVIFGTFCMAVPNLPNWIGVIICFAVLGFNAISVIKANFVADTVSEIDGKIKVQTAFIKNLTVDAEILMNKAPTDEIKAECKKVYDAVRYSDSMTNAELTAIENDIKQKFTEFENAVKNNEFVNANQTVNEFVALVDERNKKCRLLK